MTLWFLRRHLLPLWDRFQRAGGRGRQTRRSETNSRHLLDRGEGDQPLAAHLLDVEAVVELLVGEGGPRVVGVPDVPAVQPVAAVLQEPLVDVLLQGHHPGTSGRVRPGNGEGTSVNGRRETASSSPPDSGVGNHQGSGKCEPVTRWYELGRVPSRIFLRDECTAEPHFRGKLECRTSSY